MLFPTFTFAVFFLVVLVIGWLLHGLPREWKLFMLAASYVFYGYWNWRFLLLIAVSTVVNQLFAEFVHRAPDEAGRRTGVIGAVAFNLVVLGFFKYYEFFVTSVRDGFDRIGFGLSPPLLEIVLPVGISFFTFQAMSYVIDVRRGRLAPAVPLDFAVYLAFFPQLVAGPIVRASEFLPQLESRRDPRDIDLTRALTLIGAGLFKKVVISGYLAEAIVDDVFASPGRHSSLEILAGVYGYAIQIYADFSGYTDIAIGVALLLGFRFPENFNRPYAATSIQDFWRRWHITLSNWLRDYLYISLGGNRAGPTRRDRNLFLTMLLGGLWHGAAWTFVFWGAFHGIGLFVERRVKEVRPSSPRTSPGGSTVIDLTVTEPAVEPVSLAVEAAAPIATMVERRAAVSDASASKLIGRLVTFHFVCVGWVFFRADSMGTALSILWRSLTAWGDAPAVTPLLVLTIAAALAAQFVPKRLLDEVRADLSRLPVTALAVGFGVWLVIVDLLGPEGVAPFIYFQF